MTFPWQTKQWQQLVYYQQANRLPHALLLHGIEGLGKSQFAEDFAKSLLCLTDSSLSAGYCNHCHACQLVSATSHPNIKWIKPEKHTIKIDQIREANEFANHSSLKGHQRFIVIESADQMNVNAANALLKTLEEPPQHVYIILVTHQIGRLPVTIASRCQRILFQRPSVPEAMTWIKQTFSRDQQQTVMEHFPLLLALTNGAPLKALRLFESNVLLLRKTIFNLLYDVKMDHINPIPTVLKMKETEIDIFFDLMMQWTIDLLHLHLQIDAIVNHDYQEQLMQLKTRVKLSETLKFLSCLTHFRRLVSLGNNLNKQVIMESILIGWLTGRQYGIS